MKSRTVLISLLSIVLGTSVGRATTGTADIKGTAPNSPIKGTVHFEDTDAGLKVSAQLVNVPPGQHGFHIHEYGTCDQMGKAAGNHYNPFGSPHGYVLKSDIHHAHAGD